MWVLVDYVVTAGNLPYIPYILCKLTVRPILKISEIYLIFTNKIKMCAVAIT
ncbi:hypothetical protein FACS1894132_02440 [Clostridia bacterium]|nr:hypothetical protein FACS1894132_02440 [Clostridia bacterium]